MLFRSGGENCGLGLALEVLVKSGREHSDLELAVQVRPGPLRSSACTFGEAGNALILSLLFGSGEEHCDLKLRG